MPRKSSRAAVLADNGKKGNKTFIEKKKSEKKIKKRKEERHAEWEDNIGLFEDLLDPLVKSKTKKRTLEEHRLILLSLLATARRRFDLCDIDDVNWTSIEREVASDLRVGFLLVNKLRKHLFETGEILDPTEEKIDDNKEESNRIWYQTKIPAETKQAIFCYMDSLHQQGETVVASKVKAHLLLEYGIDVHRTTVSRAVKSLGLSWAPMKPKKRTFADHHSQTLRKYLILLDHYIKEEREEGENWDYVWIFMDESYIHQNHKSQFSYQTAEQKQDGNKFRKNSKGRRLIIVHAISPDGPLTTYDADGNEVSDLKWTKDTPHPQNDDNKLTAETLWIAQSHTGDYHDNMNAEMFMNWVRDRLLPTFEKKYPKKKMIFVADNAPYHHKRAIGSLGNLNKMDLVQLMVDHDVDHVDLPIDERRNDLIGCDPDVVDGGDSIRITFDPEEQVKRAGKSKGQARIGTTDELRISFVMYLKQFDPEKLECEVENLLKEKGHRILWTPPYCPELQPIELFWAAGKNHAALWYKEGQKMFKTIELLREGWYGNKGKYSRDHPYHKKPVDCLKLWKTALEAASNKFVGYCEGIDGAIGSLIVDKNHQHENAELPIDTIVSNLVDFEDSRALPNEFMEEGEDFGLELVSV